MASNHNVCTGYVDAFKAFLDDENIGLGLDDEEDFGGNFYELLNDEDKLTQDDSDGSGSDDEVPRPSSTTTTTTRGRRNSRRLAWKEQAYDDAWLGKFSPRTGPLVHDVESSFYDIFHYFLDDEILEYVTEETNKYVAQQMCLLEQMPEHSGLKDWRDTNVGELKAFIAILLGIGMDKRGSYDAYWSSNWFLERPGLKSVMSKNRFLMLFRFLHFGKRDNVLPRDNPNFDPLLKIRHFMEHIISKFQTAFYPSREVFVNKRIIPFEGWTGFSSMHHSKKSHKTRMMALTLVDANTGYIFNSCICSGIALNNSTQEVVTSLCRPLFGNRHHVYMDNYFTSPALFSVLAANNLGACGTLKTNRIGVPEAIKDANPQEGKPAVTERDGNLLFLAWKDKRQESFVLTTIHNSSTFMKVKNAPNGKREITKPCAIELYTQYVGGVDRVDRLRWTYLHIHKSLKWWKKLFLYLLETCFVNALIVYRYLHPNKKTLSYILRLELIDCLLEGYTRTNSRLGSKWSTPPKRLTERHFPSINMDKTKGGKQSKPDCVVCSNRDIKRHQTQYKCSECQLPMCAAPCFMRFHTLSDYKVNCSWEYHNS
ncbi:piggyBac transposable element-derived protein 4-like [Anneissia japonica]|uniref:piggyBac transposable element-derived protein 4-like n=1 Tax=Anneissia japonica TaxID=1529436 RepID=UPI0014255762|nr:piggyBac transposable element-derived protein 4-like [Anneissia japonica]